MIDYLKIIRPLNLLIIILTQYLLRYGVISPLLGYSDSELQLDHLLFLLLVLSTILIAAGGYVINDILDTGIDEINKPEKKIVGLAIPEKKARVLYNLLTVSGVATGLMVSYLVGKPELAITHLIAATMLYYYSYKYKYLPAWGNLSVAFLAALVLIIVWLFEYFAFREEPMAFVSGYPSFGMISSFTLGYAAFAFLSTYIREIIKDIYDVEGDQENGCRTWPVIFGIRKSARIGNLIIILTMAILLVFQYWLYDRGYIFLSIYLLVTVQLPFIWLTIKLQNLNEASRAGSLSTLAKIIMLAGILSMIFVRYNFL